MTLNRETEARRREAPDHQVQTKVLVVDDEVDILESVKNVIEAQMPDVLVIPAASAQEAWAVLSRHKVDAVVSDFKMPGKNGLELLSEVRDSMAGVPRIMITAYPAIGLAERAINEAHVEGFFVKPFDGTRLVQALRAALAERSATA